MYPYIKKSGSEQRTYCYLILEQHINPLENNERQRRVQLLELPVDDAIKPLLCVVAVIEEQWCGGWDLNPRRPMPSGPKPDPFDLARAPPRIPRQYAAKQVLKPYAEKRENKEQC